MRPTRPLSRGKQEKWFLPGFKASSRKKVSCKGGIGLNPRQPAKFPFFEKGLMLPTRVYLLFSVILLALFFASDLYPWNPSDTETLLMKMEGAYAAVNDYQANMEINTYGKDGSFKTKKFLYTFKKPKRLRLDFESPHTGMIVVYPDQDGKVALRRFFTFHLAPDNPFLRGSSGQRLDQTDMGLLITNMGRSLTNHRRGALEMAEDEKEIRIRVAADDHFRKGVVTLYQFSIDKELFLPVKVEESTPAGLLERTIVFRTLRTNIGVPDNFFQLNGG